MGLYNDRRTNLNNVRSLLPIRILKEDQQKAMKITVLGLAFLVILAASGRADTNDLSFEIHFDPQKTKLENGTNYFGIDYTLNNTGNGKLGLSNLSTNPLLEIYLINPQKNTSEVIFSLKDNFLKSISYRPLRLLQPGEKKIDTLWIPASSFKNVSSDSKLVASKLLYYTSNRDSIECMISFKVYSAAIPIGKIDIRKRENASTNARP